MSKKTQSITQREINELVAIKSNVSMNSVKKVWNNLVDLIISELKNSSYIMLENFGKFELIQTGGKDEWIEDENGELNLKFVDFYYTISFTPSQNFIKFLNNDEVGVKWSLRNLDLGEDRLHKQVKPKNLRDERTRLPVCENMKDKIINLLQKRTKKDFEVSNEWCIKIKCLDTGKSYNTMTECSREVGIGYQKLIKYYKRALKNQTVYFECDGIKFELE